MSKVEKMYKICIFGDAGVGKTALTEKYLTGLFVKDTKITIGTNFYKKALSVKGITVVLQIWDFGGQYKELFPKYIQGSSGGIFMYDLTRDFTLLHIKEWMIILKESIKAKIPILMVGGKADLVEDRKTSKELAEKFEKEYGFIDHIECSAKTGHNVDNIFTSLTLSILNDFKMVRTYT